jgi:transcriptional regulator with XRE-family HTH domain
MKEESFGTYIRRLRESKKLPLRKVAAQLDIDTSTLSKVERGERPISIKYLKPLSQFLDIELKDIQVRFISDNITKNLIKLEYLSEGLNEVLNDLKKKKK